MVEPTGRDRTLVDFSGAEAGTAPLGWGQKAILRDMRESGSQFSMGAVVTLPGGSSVEDAAARLCGLMRRHAALRTRLTTDSAGALRQRVAASGQVGLDILTMPDDADPAEVARYALDLMGTWPLARFDFHRDWPLRMAVLRHRGACTHLVWGLAHLVADGGANTLLLADLAAAQAALPALGKPRRPHLLDVARSEQEPQLRQLSSRVMRYWEAQLRDIPAQTFGQPGAPHDQEEARYWQVRFSSAAAHLAMLAIARRTAADTSAVTLAVIATAIGRVTGAHPLTVMVMANNRFRPGLANVIAQIAQNSVVTIDVADSTVDQVVARARRASLAAGMRAYYDPDELTEVIARLDGQRGYPARVTCRINDQRAMIMRADQAADGSEVTPERISQRLAETSLTWLGRWENVPGQALMVVENSPGVLSLHMIWDLWCLRTEQVERLLRGVEEIAVEAAFDPTAPTKVGQQGGWGRMRPGTGNPVRDRSRRPPPGQAGPRRR